MRHRVGTAKAAGIAVLFAACVHGASAAPPPAEVFGQLPAISEPVLSPDGRYYAAVQSYKGLPAAFIYRIDGPADSKPTVVPSEKEWFVAEVLWAKNDRLIVKYQRNYKEINDTEVRSWRRAAAVSPDGTKAVMLLQKRVFYLNNVNAAAIVDLCPDDPDYILMRFYETEDPGSAQASRLIHNEYQWFLNLLKVNVHTGNAKVLEKGNPETSDWISDGHCQAAARIDQLEKPLRDRLFLRQGSGWNEVLTVPVEADHGLEVLGLTEDTAEPVHKVWSNGAMAVLARIDASGKDKLLFAAPGYDIGNVLRDPWRGRIIGASYIDDAPKYHYFDEKRQALLRGLEKAFPGLSVVPVSSSLAGDKLIVAVSGPSMPTAYYFLDRVTHAAAFIASTYPGLADAALGDMKPFHYKARDGLGIPAYLTLPPGKEAKNLPLVVMPHGGPDARDYLAFDWWAQFMATRGYAVLQPNFRGSSGYGRKHTEAGLGQWGLAMQNDISDGVKKLIADGIADAKRVCIVGASYGGYAALAGATLSPELYACAASWAGVSDLPVMLGTEMNRSGLESQTVLFWTSRIGSAFSDEKKLIAASPARQAGNARAPILLMHGAGDTTVPIDQSERMDKALAEAGKPVEFVRFAGGEDHYLNFPATRIKMLKELERFLKQNIGN